MGSAVLSEIVLFLLCVVALLAIPVSLVFEVSRQKVVRGHIMLEWWFGLVRVPIPVAQPKAAAPETARASRPRRRERTFALIRHGPFRRRIAKFMADLWRAVGKRNVKLRIRLGLGDPAETGRFWAVMGPVAGILGNGKEVTLAIEPEFLEAVFEFDGRGTVRFVPLRILGLIVALLFSPAVWQGIWKVKSR